MATTSQVVGVVEVEVLVRGFGFVSSSFDCWLLARGFVSFSSSFLCLVRPKLVIVSDCPPHFKWEAATPLACEFYRQRVHETYKSAARSLQ